MEVRTNVLVLLEAATDAHAHVSARACVCGWVGWLHSERELLTPPLDGMILPGVTRQSLLDLARMWVRRAQSRTYNLDLAASRLTLLMVLLRQGEFKVTERTMGMKELLGALDAGRILEVFGAGTACVVCPVGSLLYRGQVGASHRDHRP